MTSRPIQLPTDPIGDLRRWARDRQPMSDSAPAPTSPGTEPASVVLPRSRSRAGWAPVRLLRWRGGYIVDTRWSLAAQAGLPADCVIDREPEDAVHRALAEKPDDDTWLLALLTGSGRVFGSATGDRWTAERVEPSAVIGRPDQLSMGTVQTPTVQLDPRALLTGQAAR